LFLLTEIWANPSLLNGELFPPNYQIFRRDRDVGRGGCVLLALRSNFVSTEILGVLDDILIRHKVDCVGVKVQIRNVSKQHNENSRFTISMRRLHSSTEN
jgi:hypothetical protein